MESQPVAPDDQQRKDGQDDGRAHQAQFLADHGKDKVVLRFRQVEEFLAAVAQAHAEEAAGADGQHGLDGLHSLAQGIVPGVAPHFDAGGHVVRGHDDDGQTAYRRAAAGDEPLGRDAAGE